MRILLWCCLFVLLGCPDALPESKAQKTPPQTAPAPSAIDRILEELKAHPSRLSASPGSTFDPAGRFADISRDLRASHVNDLVTVIISDQSREAMAIENALPFCKVMMPLNCQPPTVSSISLPFSLNEGAW